MERLWNHCLLKSTEQFSGIYFIQSSSGAEDMEDLSLPSRCHFLVLSFTTIVNLSLIEIHNRFISVSSRQLIALLASGTCKCSQSLDVS